MKYQKIKNKICIGLVIAGLAILFLGTSLVGADNLLIFFAMTMAAVLCFISATVLFVIKRGSKNEYQQLKDSYMKYNGSTFGMAREDSKAYKLYKDLNPSKKLLREWDEELLESLFAKLNENDKYFKDIQFSINEVIDRKRVNTEYWSVLLDKAVKEREIRLINQANEKNKEDNKEEKKPESKHDNRVEYNIFVNKSVDREKLYDFINIILEVVTPKKIAGHNYKSGNKYRYFYKRLPEVFEEEMNESNKKIHFRLEGDEFNLSIKKESWDDSYAILLSIKYDIEEKIFEKIESFILKEAFIASKSDHNDDLKQNVKTVYLLENGEETEEPNQMGEKGVRIEPRTINDLQKYPGIRLAYGLGAFYCMWFGKGAYELLDKDSLRSFPCYENIVLDNDVTRITLYENILEYDKKENRDKQREFLKELRIEEISTKISQEKSEERKHNVDPEINIKEGNFEHGGVRLIQTYLKDGEIAHRSEADSVEERELDENGKEVFSLIKEL